ncbi:MAG: hypothetical protein JXQ27_07610 [Acidobacteria bacterium]|nr:hypothetical protein [Acidobacteriota bacterium]
MRGCSRGIIIMLVSMAIVIPLSILLIFLPMGYVMNTHASIWWLILPAALFLLILFGGGFLALYITFTKRKRRLDAVTAPFGLSGSQYQLWFRQYHGEYRGRRLAVYFSRGPVVEADIPLQIPTRLAVTLKANDSPMLAALFKRTPLDLNPLGLGDLLVYAHNDPWAHELLKQPGVGDLLRRLAAPGSFQRHDVILRPGGLRLRFYGSQSLMAFQFPLTAQELHQQVDALLDLADIMEKLPPPEVRTEESSAEQFERSFRAKSSSIMPMVTIGIVVFMVLVCAAAGIIAFVLVSLD